MSVSSLDKESQYAVLDPKWELRTPTPTPEPAVPPSASQHKLAGKSRPQSFAQKLRSTGKSVKGKLGE